jgi:hypothetical protein
MKLKEIKFGELKVGQKFVAGYYSGRAEYIKTVSIFVEGYRDPRMGIDEPSYRFNAVCLGNGRQTYFDDDYTVRI